MIFTQISNAFFDWIQKNGMNILMVLIYTLVTIGIYLLIRYQLNRLETKGKIKPKLTDTIKVISRWFLITILVALTIGQFSQGETEWIASVLTVSGGTVLGFAAINTIGNAIAGLIVRRVKPLSRGDRIEIMGEIADVISINLIYTKMINLNRVKISIPNQKLVKMEIRNFGRNKIIRKKIKVMLSYDLDFNFVEEKLLEAANQTEYILKEPKSFVRITDFADYGNEYTLYVFFKEVKKMNIIEGNLRKNLFQICKKNNIGLTTPLLLEKVNPSAKSVSSP